MLASSSATPPTARILQKLGNLPVGEGNKTISYRPTMPLIAQYQLVAFVQKEHLGSILAAAEVEFKQSSDSV